MPILCLRQVKRGVLYEYSPAFDPFIDLELLFLLKHKKIEKVGFITFKNLVNLQLFIAITLMNIQVSYVA